MANVNLTQTLLDWPLAISGTTVEVTNDIVWGEAINVTWASAVLTNRKKTIFEIVQVDIVDNSVTFFFGKSPFSLFSKSLKFSSIKNILFHSFY